MKGDNPLTVVNSVVKWLLLVVYIFCCLRHANEAIYCMASDFNGQCLVKMVLFCDIEFLPKEQQWFSMYCIVEEMLSQRAICDCVCHCPVLHFSRPSPTASKWPNAGFPPRLTTMTSLSRYKPL